MARYKHIDTHPRLLAVDLERQLLAGSFAHAVHHLLDHDFDLCGFDGRYRNDAVGAPAYPPGMHARIVGKAKRLPTSGTSSACPCYLYRQASEGAFGFSDLPRHGPNAYVSIPQPSAQGWKLSFASSEPAGRSGRQALTRPAS
jgi:hypothetical protein